MFTNATMQFDETPTMKELTSRYRKLSLEFHPDKNLNKVEAKEKFQELGRCFKLIGDFIINNVSNAMDEEEEDFRKFFNMFNHDKKNTHCHTIYVENCNVNHWENVITKHLGTPSTNENPGLMFKHLVNKKELTLTLYKMPKGDNRSKVHLQGNELEADNYVLETMPVFYAEVRRLSQQSLEASGAVGRNLRPRSVKEITKDLSCNLCDFRAKTRRELERHSKKEHTVKGYDKQRNLQDVSIEGNTADVTIEDVEDTEENIIINDLVTTEAVPPLPPPSNVMEGFQFEVSKSLENDMTKQELVKKEKLVEELQEKVKELEKINKDLKKDNDKLKKDHATFKKEVDIAQRKTAEYCEENTELKEKIKLFEETEMVNMDILEKLKDLRSKADTDKEEEVAVIEDDDIIDIEVLSTNKNSGFRRTNPSEAPMQAPRTCQSVVTFKCAWCKHQCKQESALKAHMAHQHHCCVTVSDI